MDIGTVRIMPVGVIDTILIEEIVSGVFKTDEPECKEALLADAVDLEYENHLLTCKNYYHEDCYENDNPTYLTGFRFLEKEKVWVEDPDAEFSVIVGTQYSQVLRSNFVSKVAKISECSMCFSGQGDLERDGDIYAFTLPPDVWGDRSPLVIYEILRE